MKFWTWYLPTACISSILLCTGALVIDAAPHIVAVSALISFVITYGIVGLAIGFGAVFARYDWDNSAQLSASYGSILYMLFCCILIFFDMFPILLVLSLKFISYTGIEISNLQWYIAFCTAASLLLYLNIYTKNWAFRTGAKAMSERREAN